MLFVLEETADRNVIDVVETNNSPAFTTILANLLNKASSGLGVLHDTVGVPIENKADSVNKSIVDLYYSGKETVLNWKDIIGSSKPEIVKLLIISTAISTAVGGSILGGCLGQPVVNIVPTLNQNQIETLERWNWAETEKARQQPTWEIEDITKTFRVELTETARFFTPTPVPLPTPTVSSTPFSFPENVIFIANDTIYYCSDVALYFGISEDDLMAANPGLDCGGINKGITTFNIPPVELKSIQEYANRYPCNAENNEVCVSSYSDPVDMVAFTLYNEGGSSVGNEFSANVMQVIINRANKLITNWGFDPESLSKEDYSRVLLHVISQPADSYETVASFEAFSSSAEAATMDNDFWENAISIADDAINNNGEDWVNNLDFYVNPNIKDDDVQFYCSVHGDQTPTLGYVEVIQSYDGNDEIIKTYFFTRLQYNQSIAEWCKQNR